MGYIEISKFGKSGILVFPTSMVVFCRNFWSVNNFLELFLLVSISSSFSYTCLISTCGKIEFLSVWLLYNFPIHLRERSVCPSVLLPVCMTIGYLRLNEKIFWHAFLCKIFFCFVPCLVLARNDVMVSRMVKILSHNVKKRTNLGIEGPKWLQMG